MEIILPGTGANECIPAFRCKCQICEHARQNGGRNIRQNSSLFIKPETGSHLLVDMPPQILTSLVNSKIDEIFKPLKMIISHIGHQNMNHEELEQEMNPYGIEVCFDGMKIII